MENDLPEVQLSQTKQDDNSKYALFESAIVKYFEIIKGILPKISSLYLQNEDFEDNIFSLESKMGKLSSQVENLHYEMRTYHLAMDSKLNTAITNYTNISVENTNIKKLTQELSRQIKAVKQWKNTTLATQRSKRSASPVLIDSISEFEEKQVDMKKHKTKKAIKFDVNVNIRQTKSSKVKLSSKPSFDQEFQVAHHQSCAMRQCNSQVSEVSHQTESNEFSMQFPQVNIPNLTKSQKVLKRKGTLKKQTKFSERKQLNAKSHKIIINNSVSDDQDMGQLKDVLNEIANFHEKNQTMKQNYEKLMSQYCRINNEQFAKINQEFKELHQKIMETNQYSVQIQKIKINNQLKINELFRSTEIRMDYKVNKNQFNNVILDINNRIANIHEERKKIANRQETRKAIEFLEDKLNMLCTDFNMSNAPKLHLVELEIQASNKKISSMVTNNVQNRPNTHKTDHQQPYLIPKEPIMTKRPTSSQHARFRSENYRFNEGLHDYKYKSVEKVSQDAKTLRNNKNPTINQKLKLMREKAINIIAPKEQAKSRVKLKKERMIFEYDS